MTALEVKRLIDRPILVNSNLGKNNIFSPIKKRGSLCSNQETSASFLHVAVLKYTYYLYWQNIHYLMFKKERE